MVKPRIVKDGSIREFLTPERCFISEIWGSIENQKVSIARAVVKPGVSTVAHHLEGVDEIYLIVREKAELTSGVLNPLKLAKETRS
jgi:hypothetical protein